MTLSLIVAMAENRVIGRGSELPWHLPDDLQRFKRLTMGHTIVMGRKTFDSIGRPLPGRRMVVLTLNPAYHPAGVEIAPDLPAALRLAPDDDEIFVIGGAQVYRAALPLCDRLYLTLIRATIDGDVYFPPYDANQWVLVESIEHLADERHAHAFTMCRYDRVRPGG